MYLPAVLARCAGEPYEVCLEYGVYGDFIITCPEPYSLYLRWTIFFGLANSDYVQHFELYKSFLSRTLPKPAMQTSRSRLHAC